MSHERQGIVCQTPDSIKAYQMLCVASGLTFFAKTGQLLNTAYRPQRLLKLAEEFTGQHFRARAYVEAANAIRKKLGVVP